MPNAARDTSDFVDDGCWEITEADLFVSRRVICQFGSGLSCCNGCYKSATPAPVLPEHEHFGCYRETEGELSVLEKALIRFETTGEWD